VGDSLKRKQRNGAEIAKALAKLMTPETRARCRIVAARFGDNDALEIAARWVEDLANEPAAKRG
jgi:UDP:flavonoid glycosyltransferase YjiC (YdhE family)